MDERHGRLPLYSVPCPEALDISKPPKIISDFQGPIRSCFALLRLSHAPRLQCIDSWQYRHECKEGQQSDDRGSHASVREVLVEEGVNRFPVERDVQDQQ